MTTVSLLEEQIDEANDAAPVTEDHLHIKQERKFLDGMLGVDEREADGRAGLPGVAPEERAAPARQLDCDGEIFELRPDEFGVTHLHVA